MKTSRFYFKIKRRGSRSRVAPTEHHRLGKSSQTYCRPLPIHTCCRAFGSGAVPTCFYVYGLGLTRQGFEHLTFCIQSEACINCTWFSLLSSMVPSGIRVRRDSRKPPTCSRKPPTCPWKPPTCPRKPPTCPRKQPTCCKR